MLESKKGSVYMACYCQNCGAELVSTANFCPNCGTAVNGGSSANTENNSQFSGAAKTAATVAGAAVGVSLLGSLLRRRRRPPMAPPPRRPFGRRRGGPHGGPGPMGGPGGPGGPRCHFFHPVPPQQCLRRFFLLRNRLPNVIMISNTDEEHWVCRSPNPATSRSWKRSASWSSRISI